jgi:sulfoxide reductase catalytic subunit YedY
MIPDRRVFIRWALGFFSGLGILLSPWFSFLGRGFAKGKRNILPRGTRLQDLANKNPARLDARNLGITPLKEFETMGLDDHEVEIKTWRLEINGHVKKPISVSYEDVLAMPPIERKALMICPGFFANHGQWKGISIATLLQQAEVDRDSTHVTVQGPKGDYTKMERFPMKDILAERVFLAYRLNGQPLPVKHGFPLRVVAEDYYGTDWVKYVFRVTAHKLGRDKVSIIDLP